MQSSKLWLVIGSILGNGVLGFMFLVFLGAGAGNGNSGKMFVNKVLPVEILFFVLLCIAAFVLLARSRATLAAIVPCATLPLFILGLSLAA